MCYYVFMLAQDVEILLSEDEKALEVNEIPQSLLNETDSAILKQKQNLSSEVIGIYSKFQPMKQEAPEGMKNELYTALKNFLKEKVSQNDYADALLLARFLIVKFPVTPDIYNSLAEISVKIINDDVACNYIKLYEKKETNKPLRLLTMANFYNLWLKDYKTAIRYYEQYLKIDETKSVIYTIVGSLYAKAYGEYSLKDQIYYFEKAYKLKPHDRLILHSLAFGYEKIGDNEKADRYYRELLENNPTDTDYYNYGGFLIRCGNFAQGHKYLTHRFNIDDINLKYPLADDIERKWNFSDDISDKALLVMYEQGFGDTFMYCRFVPQLKNFAKRIIFVVQDNLYDLIKNSKIISEGVEVYSDKTDISSLGYDYHMALIDVPYVLQSDSDKLPFVNGYLTVADEKIKEYKKKYIKNNKNLKVGLSCQGNKNANYSGRDINISALKNLLNTEGIDFYSFTVDKTGAEGITPLGNTFNDFTDTACALKCMDAVVSTDNVILNLAGAMGVKTFAIFAKYPNFRWFKLTGEDVGWYKSVIPYQFCDKNSLDDAIDKIINNLR